MERSLDPDVVAARLAELRALTPEPTFAKKVSQRLAELRVLDDLARVLSGARIER